MGRLYSLIAFGAATAAFATSAAVFADTTTTPTLLNSNVTTSDSDSAATRRSTEQTNASDASNGNTSSTVEVRDSAGSPIFAMNGSISEFPQAVPQNRKLDKKKTATTVEVAAAAPTSCRQEEVNVPSICYKDETIKKPYFCTKEEERTVCKNVKVDVASTCERTVEIPCTVEQKQECADVAKVCQRMDMVDEEYVCKKQSCKTVLKSVPDTCYKKVKRLQEVACTRRVCEKTPKPSRASKASVEAPLATPAAPAALAAPKAPKSSHRKLHAKQSNQSESAATQCTRQQCSMVKEARECTKTVEKEEEYACTKTEYQAVCKDETVQVAAICKKSIVEKKPKLCKKMEEKQVCKNVTVRVPGVCTKTVMVDETYECGTPCPVPFMVEQVQQVQQVQKGKKQEKCKGKGCKLGLRRLHESNSNVQSLSCGPKTCTRSVRKEEPYKCEKTENVKECQMVPKEVTSLCHEEVTVEKPVPCKESKVKTKCENVPVSVNATCKRVVPVQETYACEGPERRVCVNVAVECAQNVEPAAVEVCRDIPATCKEPVEVQEAYACSRKVKAEECTPEQRCTRKVAVPVSYDCVESVCTDVALNTPDGCVPGALTTEQYACTETQVREQCEPKTFSKKEVCYQTITKPVPFKCMQVQTKTICDVPKDHKKAKH